ncbi:MAG TPA: hypothetical protein VIJ75_21475 [Hanamia sp.]
MDILQNNKPAEPLQRRSGLDYWSNFFLLLYILTMPFVSAFAFTGTISMPLIFAVFLFLIMAIKIIQTGKLPDGFIGFDLVIISLFLFFTVFSYMVHGLGNSKSLNHTVAYFSTFSLFYVGIKFTFFNARDKNLMAKRALQFIAYTTIISALYGNVEFISANVFGVNLNDYIPRASAAEEFYNPTVLALFYRARGFAVESGVYTQMLELFGPLTFYFMFYSGDCKWKKEFKILYTISIILSIIFAASSATFIILPVAIAFSSIVYIKKVGQFFAKKSWRFYVKGGFFLTLIIFINSYLTISASILLSIADKLDSNSLGDRQERINFFISQFSRFNPLNKLVGAGPAGSNILGYEDSGTIISLYYNITFELGIIGLFLLLLFMAYILFHNFKIKSKIGGFLMVSVVSGIVHYYVVNDYWVPWFWFIAAFTVFYEKTFTNASE